MLQRIIRLIYYSLFLVVPLIVLPHTSELFEFNKMNVIYVGAIAVGTLWSIDMVRRRQVLIYNTPYDTALGIFLLAHVVSFLFSIDKHVSLAGYYGRLNGGILSLISYVILAYAAAVYLNKDAVLKLVRISIASSVAVVIVGLPGWFGHDTLCYALAGVSDNSCWTAQFRPAERMFSTIGQPNWLAAYVGANLMLAAGYAVYLAKKGSAGYKSLTALTAAAQLLTIGILMSRSRSGEIAAALGLALFAGYFITNIRHMKMVVAKLRPYIIGYVALTIIAVVVFLTGIAPIDRALRPSFLTSSPTSASEKSTNPQPSSTATANTNITDSFAIRTIVWSGALELIKKHPLTGTGVETFAYSYPSVRPIGHNATSEWDFIYNKAHNEYLNYAATIGLAGLVGYLWYHLAVLRLALTTATSPTQQGNKSKSEDDSYAPLIVAGACATISIAITNFFGFSTSTVQLIWYVVPMLLLRLSWSTIQDEKHDLLALNPVGSGGIKQHILLYTLIAAVAAVGVGSLVNSYMADVLYAKGSGYLDADEPQQASTFLSQAVDLNPSEHVYQDKLAGALAQLALVASFSPQASDSATSITKLSQKYQTQAIEASPNNSTYYRNQGKNELLIYQITQDSDHVIRSLQSFEKAKALAPTDPRPVYSQCLVFTILAQESEKADEIAKLEQNSLDCTNEAIALKKDYFDAYVLKGQLLGSYGQIEQQQKWLDTTIKTFPQIAPADITQEMGM